MPIKSIINVGLPIIVSGVADAQVINLDWRPPAFADVEAAKAVLALADEVTKQANARAIAAVHAVRPVLTDLKIAKEVIGFFAKGRRALLHAGPPIEFARVCGPVKGALIGAVLFQGWADDEETALKYLENGDIVLDSCHHHGAVGPMAGVLAPDMPVFVVQDGGRKAYASINEGIGKVLRFGAYDQEVITRLMWMKEVIAPTLSKALQIVGPVDVTSLFGQALAMGDEGHNRNIAATALFTRRIAPALASLPAGAQTLTFLANNDHFALNLSMAAAKLAMDAAVGIENSTLVTTMARNGVEFGLRLAGTADQWFTCPVKPADGLFFPGYTIADANPDLGDSAITETLGIGGFAMAASPAITRFVGGSPSDAIEISQRMERITIASHPAYQIPILNFKGAPSGIDALKVLETGVLPVINTGIAHKKAGVGQIGAGVVQAPAEVFQAAVKALYERRFKTGNQHSKDR